MAGQDAAGNQDELYLGLHFKLSPGWKIYWRSPGDAGFPPELDWAGSENLAEAEILWPVPHRFMLFGLQTFGYGEEVVLPVRVAPERPGEALRLRARLTYLACSDICVPHDGDLGFDLEAGPAVSTREGGVIAEALGLVPGRGAEAGLDLEMADLAGSQENPVLRVVARSDVAFDSPDVLVEGPPGFLFAPPEIALGDQGRRAALTVTAARSPLAQGVLEGKRLVLTVTDGTRGLEQEVIARFGEAPSAPPADLSTWLVMLGLALLGGLILNLMPCVLPVLSIKLLSVVSHGGGDRRAVRVGFLASALGILFSFLVLAGLALVLKAAGLAAGWGIQFQQPIFLSAMAAIITLFACNLLGIFEISLPAWLGGLAAGGANPDSRSGLAGHFATGAFATLLATPCSAPFLGTAVGFALARGAPEILAIFAALGLGLALPYILVAAAPGLATRLPRPGAWMVTLRRILGLALAGTALWLLTVMAAQIGPSGAAAVGALLVAIPLVLSLHGRLPMAARGGLVALLILAGLAAPAGFSAPEPADSAVAEAWEPFDLAAIDRHVAEGKVVFVDVTADWCITCQVNKALVIDQGEVAERLAGDRVVRMRADWTLPSDEIAAYLASFGRYGIPFNAVYGPGSPEGAILPELLTNEAVITALEGAAVAPRTAGAGS